MNEARTATFLPSTRLAGATRAAAAAILALTIAAMAALVAYAVLHQAAALTPADAGSGDLATYAQIVGRLHAGEAYYPAVHAELLAGDYGTRSVFNWRTPLYFSLVALSPSPALTQGAIAILAFGAAAVVFLLFRRDRGVGFAGLATFLILLSLAAIIVPGGYFFAEVPAGILILLSVAAYGLGQRALGLAAAIAALFIRELAAPYVIVCVALALADRRWREVGFWAIALALYAAYFGWHVSMVHGMLGAGDRAYAEGWLQFGGLGFVLATAGFNGVLIAAPAAVSAGLVPVAALGFAAWPGGERIRPAATVALYALLFAAVGKPFNVYWGALCTPLLTLALPWAIAGLRDLAASTKGRPGGLS